MTQAVVAEHTNVTRQAVSKWEANTCEPDIGNIKILAKIFGIKIDNLLYDDEETLIENTLRIKREDKRKTTRLTLVIYLSVTLFVFIALMLRNSLSFTSVLIRYLIVLSYLLIIIIFLIHKYLKKTYSWVKQQID